MTQFFSVQDDHIVIDKLKVSQINSAVELNDTCTFNNQVTHQKPVEFNNIVQFNAVITNTAKFANSVQIASDLTVGATLHANTLRVKNIVADSSSFGNWDRPTDNDLHGLGLKWSSAASTNQLVYRDNRLWSSINFDLKSGNSYKIDNSTVLSENELGSTVIRSNLRKVGTLGSLTVSGDTELGNFLYVNSSNNRIGINTTMPSSHISIVDQTAELNVGIVNAAGHFGMQTNNDLLLLTDNKPRITIKANGDVVIPGKLIANNFESNQPDYRLFPLEFRATPTASVYNTGIVWNNTSSKVSFLFQPSPNRLVSSCAIAASDYYVNNTQVLTETTLGPTVVESNLSKLGTLESLAVTGLTQVSQLNATELTTPKLSVNNYVIDKSGISSKFDFKVNVNNTTVILADEQTIQLGSEANKLVKVNGAVSIGVNVPDPTMALTVNGPIQFDNKKFISGTEPPSTGRYNVSDICWNTAPTPDGFVGWICITAGTPGTWLPFGAINRVK